MRTRLEVYRKETLPLVEYYRNKGILKRVKSEGGIQKVFAAIIGADRKTLMTRPWKSAKSADEIDLVRQSSRLVAETLRILGSVDKAGPGDEGVGHHRGRVHQVEGGAALLQGIQGIPGEHLRLGERRGGARDTGPEGAGRRGHPQHRRGSAQGRVSRGRGGDLPGGRDKRGGRPLDEGDRGIAAGRGLPRPGTATGSWTYRGRCRPWSRRPATRW